MAMNEKQAVALAKHWAEKYGVDKLYQPARWIVEMLMVVATPMTLTPLDNGQPKHVFFVGKLDGRHGVGICERLPEFTSENQLTPELIDGAVITPAEEGLLILMMDEPSGDNCKPVAMWSQQDGGKWHVAHQLRGRIAECERDIEANTDPHRSMAGAHMAAGTMSLMLERIEKALVKPGR